MKENNSTKSTKKLLLDNININFCGNNKKLETYQIFMSCVFMLHVITLQKQYNMQTNNKQINTKVNIIMIINDWFLVFQCSSISAAAAAAAVNIIIIHCCIDHTTQLLTLILD